MKYHAPEPLDSLYPAHTRRRVTNRENRETGESDYDFLVNRYITQATLDRAKAMASQWQVPIHDVLISRGWISQADYTRALADYAGVNYLQKLHASEVNLPNIPEKIQESFQAGLFTGREKSETGQSETVILASRSPTSPSALKRMMKRLGHLGERLKIVSTHQLLHTISAVRGSLLTKESIYGLENSHPNCSASHGLSLPQKIMLSIVFATSIIALILFPVATIITISLVLSFLFFFIIALRVTACYYTWRQPAQSGQRSWRQAAIGLTNDATLPVYTLLIPIFREKEVLLNLIQALLRIDYPSAKLDIKLIFEQCDPETLQVARSFTIPDHIEFIIVPDSQPRTKPKALNYAMQFARGDYVVIYDAEDQPAPDQLRKAVTAFRLAPDNVACLQAKLAFYNSYENWLTRQFAIEYSALFNGILPTLQSLDLPIPLGGTSNHFRMSALKKIGAWDAFNVTEDADLGMRLYRSGYSCRILNSVTWEEATCTRSAWIPQRTRWIKGWMQTYAVHMRNPVRLLKQLGLRGFLGFQVTIGGFLTSAFIHPIFITYLLSAITVNIIYGSEWSMHWLSNPLWILAFINLFLGYSSAMALGTLATWRTRKFRLIPSVLTMPLYWLLISFAAYRALIHFFLKPFLWEKTRHGLSKIHARPGGRKA